MYTLAAVPLWLRSMGLCNVVLTSSAGSTLLIFLWFEIAQA
jgi:hypothetical protein